MITAVDTSVLLDIFIADPDFGPSSMQTLRRAQHEGRLIACDVVWAEVRTSFPDANLMLSSMESLGVEFSPVEQRAALKAGEFWRVYHQRGGKKQRMIADFLIGAHAFHHADRLLTRDRGFYRNYFRSLKLLDPALAH